MRTAVKKPVIVGIPDAPADVPALADPIEQLIHEGDARSDKSAEYAASAKAADEEAADAASKALLFGKQANDMLISAGLKYLEAKATCELAKRPWLETLATFCRYTRQHVARCMKIAKSDNPARAAAEHRARDAAQSQNYRDKLFHGTDDQPVSSMEQDDTVEPHSSQGAVSVRGVVDEDKQLESDEAYMKTHTWTAVLHYAMGFNALVKRYDPTGEEDEWRAPVPISAPGPTFLRAVRPVVAPEADDPHIRSMMASYIDLPSKQVWIDLRLGDGHREFKVRDRATQWLSDFDTLSELSRASIKRQIHGTGRRTVTQTDEMANNVTVRRSAGGH